jgi:predicted DsbA family dithiol-disulfide isomerase
MLDILFKHFPLSSTCNPAVSKDLVNEASCLAARATGAGGRFAGVAGFWAIHSWIKQNRETLDVDSLTAQIRSIGVEYTWFARVMNSPEITTAINQDVEEAKQLGLLAIPLLYVNDRWVPRWYLEGEDVLFEIFAAAKSESVVSSRTEASLSGQ